MLVDLVARKVALGVLYEWTTKVKSGHKEKYQPIHGQLHPLTSCTELVREVSGSDIFEVNHGGEPG